MDRMKLPFSCVLPTEKRQGISLGDLLLVKQQIQVALK